MQRYGYNRTTGHLRKNSVNLLRQASSGMAQIELKKTAEQAEESHPYAAEVLKKNTYMDDICNSVHTVENAQQLTKDIDEILDSGGLKVKEWS